MQLDLKLEKDIDEFLGKDKTTVSTTREFVIKVEGKR